jgi:hypothetical protein
MSQITKMSEEWQNYIDIENIDYGNDPYFQDYAMKMKCKKSDEDLTNLGNNDDDYDRYKMSEKKMRILTHIFGLIIITLCYIIITLN